MVLPALLLACAPAPEAPAPAATAPAEAPVPVLTEVRLAVAKAEGSFRWSAELRGLSTAAIELGLADLPGVWGVVTAGGAAPSLLRPRPTPRRTWDAALTLRPAGEGVAWHLELCTAGRPCAGVDTQGTREAPWPAFAALLQGAAAALDVPVPAGVAEVWATPGSKDPYAELITGRSAAMYYGILPPHPADADPARDPVPRAVRIDPGQPLAQWLYARWQVGATSHAEGAATALGRARLARPGSPLLAADLATVLDATAHPDQALVAWEELAKGAPRDPRWPEPYATALLGAGRAREAQVVLDHVPEDFAWDASYARLRVEVAEALGGVDLDPLLERWQRADEAAVAPVRRRIELRVARGDWDAALILMPVLSARAPGAQTDAWHAALLAAAGRLDEAAALSPPEVAARLRARAAREKDPAAAPEGLPADDLDGRLAAADAALWRNEPALALNQIDAAMSAAGDPTAHADLYVLRARALEATGRTSEATEAWRRAWSVDPAAEGGPVTSRRVSSTFHLDPPASPPGAPSP